MKENLTFNHIYQIVSEYLPTINFIDDLTKAAWASDLYIKRKSLPEMYVYLDKKINKKKKMKGNKLYYSATTYDVIDIIQDYKLSFNRGNIIKYIIRAGKKDDELQDLLKALDYLEREVEHIRHLQKIETDNIKEGH